MEDYEDGEGFEGKECEAWLRDLGLLGPEQRRLRGGIMAAAAPHGGLQLLMAACSSLSQNHRIAEVGRVSRRSSSRIPLLKQVPYTRSHR